MDLFSPKTIKELLENQGKKPVKSLGQNFLLEKRVAFSMLKAADLSPADTVLEIGPGIGTLTRELAKTTGKVIAVEKDKAMVEILKETLNDLSNVLVIHEDVLKINLDSVVPSKYKVVANLPYYITSPVIRMFLEAGQKPELLVLTVQKEVAQRIAAKPPEMSLLAVAVQFHAEAKIVSKVPKTAFWPQPEVDSAILQLVPHKEAPEVPLHQFFSVVKAGFVQPRKQLLNNLSSQLKLPKEVTEAWLNHVGIDPKQRAETLSVQDWISLTKTLPVDN